MLLILIHYMSFMKGFEKVSLNSVSMLAFLLLFSHQKFCCFYAFLKVVILKKMEEGEEIDFKKCLF